MITFFYILYILDFNNKNNSKKSEIKMNIIVHNRRDLEFNLADMDILIKDYIQESGTIKYLIEVRMCA